MHRVFVIVSLFAFLAFAVLLGCQTTQSQPDITRADVTRAMDLGELATSLALTYAETRGADVTQLRATATATFDVARDAIGINLSSTDKAALQIAFNQIKALVSDALKLAESVGVPPAKIALIGGYAEEAYAVIQRLIDSLPDSTK